MKNELYYLLSNTTIAKNTLRISVATLAHILGVSVKSIERWYSNAQKPSELNMYKLHWFVYLVLDMNVPLDKILHDYDIAGMTYFSDPTGNFIHCEPWNYEMCSTSVSCPGYNMSDSMINVKDAYSPCDTCTFKCIPVETNDDICDIIFVDDLYKDDNKTDTLAVPATLSAFIAAKNRYTNMADTEKVCDLLEHELSLISCTYQEALRRILALKELCEIYIHDTEETLDYMENDFCETYIKVHDYDSFIEFLDMLTLFSEFDERFSTEKDRLKMKISSYTDPALKVVNTKEVKTLRAYKDYLVFTCEDGSVYELPNDKSFVITSSSAFNSPNHDFMIRVGDNYYALSFELK